MPRFSANLGFLWTDRPLLERIDAAARAGFRAVELHWPYEVPAKTLRTRLVEQGLTLVALNTPTGSRPGDFGLGAVPGREAEFRGGFGQAIAYAIEAGAGAIHVMAGIIAAENRAHARLTFLDNLRAVLPAAEQARLTLLLEPINHRDRPGYFYDRIAEAVAIVEALGSPAVKVMFDCYHVGITEGDVPGLLERHYNRIGHIQIAAVPSRAEPDEGTLDYASIFATLDRLDYAGWVGAEYKPRSDTDAGLGWFKRQA